jgi:hypothetical protein
MPSSPWPLFFIQDQTSHQHFLVDIGACFFIFPHPSSVPATSPLLTGSAAVLRICIEKMWMRIQEKISMRMWMRIHALTELWRAK